MVLYDETICQPYRREICFCRKFRKSTELLESSIANYLSVGAVKSPLLRSLYTFPRFYTFLPVITKLFINLSRVRLYQDFNPRSGYLKRGHEAGACERAISIKRE